VGLYNDQPSAAAVGGSSVWDFVPGDTVAHAIVATAAAVASAGARGRIAAAAGGGWGSGEGVVEGGRGAGSVTMMGVQEGVRGIDVESGAVAAGAAAGAARERVAGEGEKAPPLLIVQVATSCTYPLLACQLFNQSGTITRR